MGLILAICILIVLGMTLAWIAAIVAKEEVEIKTGVIILLLVGICSFAYQFTVVASSPDLKWTTIFVNFALLIAMIHLIAHLGWKHSAIIAAIYTGLLFLVGVALGTCAAAVS